MLGRRVLGRRVPRRRRSGREGFEAKGVGFYVGCAKEVGAEAGCGGYVPCLPSVLEIFEKSKVFARMTETEQHEFHWTNKDYVTV